MMDLTVSYKKIFISHLCFKWSISPVTLLYNIIYYAQDIFDIDINESIKYFKMAADKGE